MANLSAGNVAKQHYLSPHIFTGLVDGDNGFKLMQNWPLPAPMVDLIFFAVLNLSTTDLCRKVLNK